MKIIDQIRRTLRIAGKDVSRSLLRFRRPRIARAGRPSYADRLAEETQIYKDVVDVNVLPEIFHYWSNRYLRPMLEEFGASNPDQFFAKYLRESAKACGDQEPVFISIGAGNCDTEVRIARLIKNSGIERFVIECLDINSHMLRRGSEMAAREGLTANLAFVEGDFNSWKASKRYAGIMANQALHHVLNLEGLFDEIRRSLKPAGYFVISDMIGRNGHQRWPEALNEVHRFWRELPVEYRYNRQLDRHEELYQNWDCSGEGFEGIRSQDIMPCLLERFSFAVYIGFANVIDVFIDRAFGHNFEAGQKWDRSFIDRVHEFDEQALRSGAVTPTHMLSVVTTKPTTCRCSRGLSPESGVRRAEM